MKKAFTQTTIILNVIYGLIILLFLLDEFTSFDIKNQVLKSFVYFGILIGMPIMLFWNLFSKQLLLIIYPILILVLIIVVDPIRIVFQSSVWETRAIFYEHKYKNKTIELQWQDMGARGYNRREVEAIYLTPLFIIAREIPPNFDENPDWIKNNSPIIIE